MYPQDYDLFKGFKLNPIGDARFAVLNGTAVKLTEDQQRYAILDREEFSCLEFHMDRDTISRILKK